MIAPRDADDVVLLMQVLARSPFSQLAITGRGGGTGTNGQSLNTGVVVDFRRFMHRILAVDPAGEWVDVEQGPRRSDARLAAGTTRRFGHGGNGARRL